MIVNISDTNDPRIEVYQQIRERDLVGREGLFVAEGKIVLQILLKQKDYALQSVLLLESRVATNTALISSIPDNIPVYVVPQNTMDAIAGYHVHRGIMAIGKRIITNTLREIIHQAAADSLLVILSDISNHDNVGSIFRNAAAFSADAVVLDNRCCDPLYRKALRVSVGGVLNVPWVQGLPVAEILTILTENSFETIALSPAGTRTISEIPKSGRRALLLGSEGHGLPSALLDSLSSYKIPMSPQFDSLNVATASGIALYTASRYSA